MYFDAEVYEDKESGSTNVRINDATHGQAIIDARKSSRLMPPVPTMNERLG